MFRLGWYANWPCHGHDVRDERLAHINRSVVCFSSIYSLCLVLNLGSIPAAGDVALAFLRRLPVVVNARPGGARLQSCHRAMA